MLDGSNESKCTPKENQDAHRYGDLLRRRQAEKLSESTHQQIEENVVPSRIEPQAGHLATLDQLGKPGVVHVAGKIARSNASVPKAGKQHEGRYGKNFEVIPAHEKR